MVRRPWSSSTETGPDSRTLISMGRRSVMEYFYLSLFRPGWRFAMLHGIIRWRVSWAKEGRQREAFQKFMGPFGQPLGETSHQKNKFKVLKIPTLSGGTHAYNAGPA